MDPFLWNGIHFPTGMSGGLCLGTKILPLNHSQSWNWDQREDFPWNSQEEPPFSIQSRIPGIIPWIFSGIRASTFGIRSREHRNLRFRSEIPRVFQINKIPPFFGFKFEGIISVLRRFPALFPGFDTRALLFSILWKNLLPRGNSIGHASLNYGMFLEKPRNALGTETSSVFWE